MLAKVCVLIVSLGLCGCVLLTLRQQRLQVVSDMAAVHKRIGDKDKELLRLRSAIAQASSPRRIETLASGMGPMAPIGVDPVAVPGREAPAMKLAETKPTKPANGKPGPEVARRNGR